MYKAGGDEEKLFMPSELMSHQLLIWDDQAEKEQEDQEKREQRSRVTEGTMTPNPIVPIPQLILQHRHIAFFFTGSQWHR